jgi:hypothetical protein
MSNRLTQGEALVGRLHADDDINATDDLTVGDDATITGDLIAGTLAVGSSGSTVKKIATGTGVVDLPSISSHATGSGTFTVTGAASGDAVVVNPPALTAGLVFAGAAVTGTDTVTVYAVNTTGSSINEASATFRYLWFDLT